MDNTNHNDLKGTAGAPAERRSAKTEWIKPECVQLGGKATEGKTYTFVRESSSHTLGHTYRFAPS